MNNHHHYFTRCSQSNRRKEERPNQRCSAAHSQIECYQWGLMLKFKRDGLVLSIFQASFRYLTLPLFSVHTDWESCAGVHPDKLRQKRKSDCWKTIIFSCDKSKETKILIMILFNIRWHLAAYAEIHFGRLCLHHFPRFVSFTLFLLQRRLYHSINK